MVRIRSALFCRVLIMRQCFFFAEVDVMFVNMSPPLLPLYKGNFSLNDVMIHHKETDSTLESLIIVPVLWKKHQNLLRYALFCGTIGIIIQEFELLYENQMLKRSKEFMYDSLSSITKEVYLSQLTA